MCALETGCGRFGDQRSAGGMCSRAQGARARSLGPPSVQLHVQSGAALSCSRPGPRRRNAVLFESESPSGALRMQ